MKQLLTTLTCILVAGSLYAQDTCFSMCMEKLEQSTLPVPEKNLKILQELVGCKAPHFNVKTIHGEILKLDELQGKVVVINFWYEGCAPCVAEMPALNKLQEEYKTKDVVFIAFSRDNTKSIKEFVKRSEFNYHLVSSDYDLAYSFCVIAGWPTNMVLDKKGIVRQLFSGGQIDERAKTGAYNKMQPTIEKYLNAVE